MQIKKGGFDKQKTESIFNSPTFGDTYTATSISHLQTMFNLLILGYVLALACFVTEIMWHLYRSKRRGPTGTSVRDGHK